MPIKGLKLEGAAAAAKAFRALPPLVQQETGEATRSTVLAIVAIARAKVRVRYGILQRHIDSSYSAATGQGRVGVRSGNILVTPGGVIGARRPVRVNPATYAALVETGSVHAKAFPFMLPAVEAQREPYLRRCREAGQRVEAKATGFGAGRIT